MEWVIWANRDVRVHRVKEQRQIHGDGGGVVVAIGGVVMATDRLLRALGLGNLTSCRVQEETYLWRRGRGRRRRGEEGEEEVRMRKLLANFWLLTSMFSRLLSLTLEALKNG